MKKKIALLLTTFTMVSCLSVCNAEAADKTETVVPTIHAAAVESGSVTVYDFGASKLHVYNTGDALGDVAQEPPSRTARLPACSELSNRARA